MDSEIQNSKVTEGNIKSICVVNVSADIHLDYWKTKIFIAVGDFVDSALLLIDLLVCT